jgi:hypothetical protein
VVAVAHLRVKSVDSSWSDPLDVPLASAPVATGPFAAGTETHAAMTVAVVGPARRDDATPIVDPLPRTPIPRAQASAYFLAARIPWYKRWPFALAVGATAGVAFALMSIALERPATTAPVAPAAAPIAAPIVAPAAPAATAPQPAAAAPAKKLKPKPKLKKHAVKKPVKRTARR